MHRIVSQQESKSFWKCSKYESSTEMKYSKKLTKNTDVKKYT